MKITKFGLCKYRHDIPYVDGYIFEKDLDDPFNYGEMRKTIAEKLKKEQVIHLYVTGLTTALMEVVKYCLLYNKRILLLHYDRDKKKYIPQLIN